MRHVFVETNWLHAYAAPAHHKVLDAVTLLERAQRGEFMLHIPNVSFSEARQSIQSKCQPVDGPGIRRYIRWARKNGELDEGQAREAHQLAEKYVQSIDKELSDVPSILNGVAGLPCVKMFAFDDMPSWRAYWSLLPGFGTKESAGVRLPRRTATYSHGARREGRRTICASFMMMLTFGSMATSPCNSLHAPLILISLPCAVITQPAK